MKPECQNFPNAKWVENGMGMSNKLLMHQIDTPFKSPTRVETSILLYELQARNTQNE